MTPFYNCRMDGRLKKGCFAVSLAFVIPLVAVASQQDDKAADAVSSAFIEARQAAHLSKLDRIDRNRFRKQVCKHDLRMPSGLITDVLYETADPARLPDAARQLATSSVGYQVVARFGVGVCSLGPDSSGKVTYSVLIATYASRWGSFWRIFWD
ncbi:MAG: hypothetical protein WB762_23350 [Candidatus Sulfotelmatobacter sp.]